MEECRTPTLAAQMMEFKYELTPTMVFDASRLQEAQNLIVNRIHVRCFTPTIKNFQSPGLSPINECIDMAGMTVGNIQNLQKSVAPMQATIQEEPFKAPVGKPKQPKSSVQQQQQQQLFKQSTQQTQQQMFNGKNFVSDSPPIFTLNSTVDSETDFSADITSPDSAAILGNYNTNNNKNNNNNSSDSSNSPDHNNNSEIFTPNNNNNTTNFLNRTMNISTLLRSIGLDEYIEPFEQDLDLEEFLNIRTEDFVRLGVRTVEHQKKLLDLLSKFNGD
ncbi:protein matrimony [Eurosta solidaginis]|uniref:protein matrimony n=1 Tax=Eurosta solidaginis TaxID=178769 RepID=UPI0035315BF3